MAEFRFIGGPLRGLALEHADFSKIANSSYPPVWTENGMRFFVLFPPLDECQKIIRGELTKEQASAFQDAYERGFGCEEYVEFRYVSPDQFDHVTKKRSASLSPEATARKAAFAQRADELIQEVRNAKITHDSIITLITHYSDQTGVSAAHERNVVSTPLTLTGFPPGEATYNNAMKAWVENAIGNLDNAVRNAPTGLVPASVPSGVQVKQPLSYRIEGFSVEIQ